VWALPETIVLMPVIWMGKEHDGYFLQEGQHPLTGQRAANFRLLATSEPNAG